MKAFQVIFQFYKSEKNLSLAKLITQINKNKINLYLIQPK